MSLSLPCGVILSITRYREGSLESSLQKQARGLGPPRLGEVPGKGADDLGGYTAPLSLLVYKKLCQWNLSLNEIFHGISNVQN